MSEFSGPIPPVAPLPGIQRQYEPNPDDRIGAWALGWLGFVAYFVVLEAYAIRQDARNNDRVKRTLTANLRYVFATDSVTGVPLDVRLGKTRRLLLSVALGPGWLPNHLGREGVV